MIVHLANSQKKSYISFSSFSQLFVATPLVDGKMMSQKQLLREPKDGLHVGKTGHLLFPLKNGIDVTNDKYNQRQRRLTPVAMAITHCGTENPLNMNIGNICMG